MTASAPQAFFLPLTDLIILPDRQRQEFDPAALLELAGSLSQHGMFHAILVQPDGKTLVTGERRVRAVREHLIPLGRTFTYGGEPVPPGTIPAICISATDPLALEEIELDENLKRKDLTWKEMAQTTARLHALRQKQAEVRAAEAAQLPPVDGQNLALTMLTTAHTVADTAREVRGSAEGYYQEATRQEILVAKHLDKPEVAAAPTLKEAFKALKRLEDGERNRTLAAAVGSTYSADKHKIFHDNCLNWMAKTEHHGKFDVILTDPPYGMDAQNFGDAAGKLSTIDHQYDDTYENWLMLMGGVQLLKDGSKQKVKRGWCDLSFLVTKAEAHAYVFCDIDHFHELKMFMERAGWYVFRTPLTNYKRNSGRVPLPDQGPRRQSEWCLYAIKGKKIVTGIYSDVIVTDSDEQLGHGAQKPVALYVDLLKRSVKPGDEVLDSFAGSGTILPAGHSLRCYVTAVEQQDTYYGKCLERAKLLGQEPELPL